MNAQSLISVADLLDGVQHAFPSQHLNLQAVTAVYIYGSQIYGCFDPLLSDYDFLILHDNFTNADYQPSIDSGDNIKEVTLEFCHYTLGMNIEAHIMDTQFYFTMLLKHNALIVKTAYFPLKAIIFEKEHVKYMRCTWFKEYNVQYRYCKIKQDF